MGLNALHIKFQDVLVNIVVQLPLKVLDVIPILKQNPYDVWLYTLWTSAKFKLSQVTAVE